MGSYNDMSPNGTLAQNALLFYGRNAIIASTWKVFGSLANNQTFIVPENSSGTPTLVTFEAKLADYARGTLTCVAKANLVNNETFTLDDGVNAATVFEFQVDGSFTPAGGGVVAIDIQTATTAIEVAALVHAAINAVGAGLAITSTNSGTATLALVNDAYGAYNAAISDTVTDAGFTHTGMSGGAAWTATGGAVVVVDCAGDTTRPEVLADFRDFLNARPNAAYTWAINGTDDGLVGTAKLAGSAWNYPPSGSTLTASSVSTAGRDPVADQGAKIDSLASGGFMDEFANMVSRYAPGASRMGSMECAAQTGLVIGGVLKIPTLGIANTFPGGGIGMEDASWYRFTNCVIDNPASGPWAFGAYLRIGTPTSGKLGKIMLADYRYPAQNQRIEFAHDYSIGGTAQTKYYLKCVTSAGATGGPQYMTESIGDGFNKIFILYDGVIIRVFCNGALVGVNTDIGNLPAASTSLSVMAYISGLNAGYGVCRLAWAQ